MIEKVKHQTHEAIRHGAAWFTAAGISAGVFGYVVFDFLKNFLN